MCPHRTIFTYTYSCTATAYNAEVGTPTNLSLPTSGSAAKIFKSQLMGRFGATRRTDFLKLTLPLFAFFEENGQHTLPLLRFFGLFSEAVQPRLKFLAKMAKNSGSAAKIFKSGGGEFWRYK